MLISKSNAKMSAIEAAKPIPPTPASTRNLSDRSGRMQEKRVTAEVTQVAIKTPCRTTSVPDSAEASSMTEAIIMPNGATTI